MNVLVACEESQRVCTAFREKGHNAFSCDILPCSGGHPEWHIQGDVLEILNPVPLFGTDKKGIGFHTCDGEFHGFVGKWDLIIAHPPLYLFNQCRNTAVQFQNEPSRKGLCKNGFA